MSAFVEAIIQDEGVELAWCGSQSWDPGQVEFAEPAERGAHQRVQELVLDEVLRQKDDHTWRLKFDDVWKLDHEQLQLLELPTPAQFAARLFTQPGRTESGARLLGVDLRNEAYGVLNNRPVHGPFVDVGDGAYLMMPQELCELILHAEAGPDSVERESRVAGQQVYYAVAKQLAIAAGASIEPWLAHENYVFADTIGVAMEGNLKDGIELRAEATGLDEPALQDLLARNDGGRSVVWIKEGSDRKRLILDGDQTAALAGLHRRGSRIEPGEVADFIENPEAFLPPEIDLSEFSERVKGLKIRVYDSTPYVSVRQEKLKWFPTVDVDVVPVAGGSSGTGAGEDAQLTPPNLSEGDYLEKVRQARNRGETHIIQDGAIIRFDPQVVDPILAAEARIGSGMQHGVEGSRAYILEIFENVDQLDFILEEAPKDPVRPESVREILEFEVPESLAATLMPFQETGYRWLRTLDLRGRGGLLADDMGLGKTIQVISYLAASKEVGSEGPALVVVPKTLIDNWVAEIRKFCPSLRVGHYAGGIVKDSLGLRDVDLVLTTYDRLRINQVELARVDWGAVVCDEAQAIKNPTTGRTTAVKALKSRMRIAVTGTPVENGLSELWSILDWVQPGLLRSRAEFRTEHERPIVSAEDEKVRKGEIERLQGRIVNHYLRRMKSELPEGLSDKLIHRRESALSGAQVGEYLASVRGAQGGGRGSMLACLQQLLMLSACPWDDHTAYGVTGSAADLERCPKLASTIDILDRVRDVGEKALIFVERLAVQGMLQSVLANRYGIRADLINGSVTRGRQALVDAFSARDGFQVMILSPRVGGTGLNITSANHVIHYMRPWNPAIENQATDRTHRIGQERDVHVYLPIAVWPDEAERSVEQVLDELIRSKMDLATDVIVPTAKMSLDGEVMAKVFGGGSRDNQV